MQAQTNHQIQTERQHAARDRERERERHTPRNLHSRVEPNVCSLTWYDSCASFAAMTSCMPPIQPSQQQQRSWYYFGSTTTYRNAKAAQDRRQEVVLDAVSKKRVLQRHIGNCTTTTTTTTTISYKCSLLVGAPPLIIMVGMHTLIKQQDGFVIGFGNGSIFCNL
jgi:hypothetical protein